MSTTERICKCCSKPFLAKTADVKRGWAKFCSKSCKAKKQEQVSGNFKDYIRKRDYARDAEIFT
jgi:hypothetical protein